jgi:uncharacterized protein
MYVSKINQYFDTPEPGSKMIMNLLSGSMDIVDEEMFHFLSSNREQGEFQPGGNNKDALMKCLERGYIYNDRQEEEKKLMETAKTWDESVKHRAESYTIYPNFTCNLQCVYCFENQVSKSKAGVMSPEMLTAMMNAMDIIHQGHHSNRRPLTTIFGGEPLLKSKKQIEFIEALLKELKKRNFRTAVITNGVELPHYSKILSDHGVEVVEVTIDGPKEIHDQRRIFPNGKGSFDKVVEGIESVIAQEIHTVVRVNIDNENIECLPDLADFILEKGWIGKKVHLHLHAIDAQGSENHIRCDRVGPEMLSKLFDMYNSNEKIKIFSFLHRAVKFFEDLLHFSKLPFPRICYCGAVAGSKYSFDLYGNIFPCCCMNCCALEEFNHGKFYPELKFNKEIVDKWRQRDVLNLSQCRDCPEVLLCGGGCTRVALMSGESLEDGVFCPSHREEFQIALNYYYPMLKKKFLSGNEA